MDVHCQKLHPHQMLKKLLTEWKNTKKQKCTVLDSVSRDPEELTEVQEAPPTAGQAGTQATPAPGPAPNASRHSTIAI